MIREPPTKFAVRPPASKDQIFRLPAEVESFHFEPAEFASNITLISSAEIPARFSCRVKLKNPRLAVNKSDAYCETGRTKDL